MGELVDKIEKSVGTINKLTDFKPTVGIILGTGQSELVKEMEVEKVLSYGDIPNFPVPTVESHEGRLILGNLSHRRVLALQGRFHCYEGYSMEQIVFPVRVMKALGVEVLICSNAGGGLNPLFQPGDLMAIVDHINLLGDNPLIGPNEESLGPRFPDMYQAYDPELLKLAEVAALEERIPLRKGVYVALPGPSLETPAEYRMLRVMGGDAVGMSTVPEVIAARHMGMRVLGLSVITDMGLPDALSPVSFQEILQVAERAEPALTILIRRIVEGIEFP